MSSAAPNIKQEVVDDTMAGVLRTKSPADRLAMAHGMWRSAARMIQCMLRSEHPDWSEDQIHCEAARRLSHGAG